MRGSPRPGSHYGPDLARVHHEHFGALARAAGRELVSRLRRAGLHTGTVIDLAAGSGVLSRSAMEAGFDVVAVDVSDDMLAIAREEAAGARFVRGSLWGVALEPCVAVAAVGEAMSYANDPAGGPQGLRERLGAIHRALAPGGLLLFDVASPGRSGPSGCRRGFWNVGTASLGLVEREAGSELTRCISMFIPDGSLWRRVDEEHALHLHRVEDVESALTESGFVWDRLSGYDDVELAAGWNAFAATKP